MKRLIGCLLLLSPLLSSCSQAPAELEPAAQVEQSSPLSWVIHDGERYTFAEVHPSWDIESLELTGEQTGLGDGFEVGTDIYRLKSDKTRLFLWSPSLDKSDPAGEWGEYRLER